MKKHLLIISISMVVIALASCGRNAKLMTTLDTADRLMENRPDSALSLLSGLKDSVRDGSKSVQMRYELMKTEAEDKCYITHTSDSTMLVVTNYFNHHGNLLQRMKAYYLLGRVYSDMQFTGDAVDSYKKALYMEGHDDSLTYTVRARASNWIGQTLMYQRMYKKAYGYFLRSYCFSKKTGIVTIEIYLLRNIGRCLSALNEEEKGLSYFRQSALMARKTGNVRIFKVVMAELACNYMDLKDYEKARQALDVSYYDEDSVYDHACLARYYYETGKTDSAAVYYRKSLNRDNIPVCLEASLKLFAISTKQGHQAEANVYLHQSMNCADSLDMNTIRQNQNLIKALGKKLEHERQLNHAEKMRNDVIFLMILCFVVFAFLVICYVRSKKARSRIQQEKMRQLFSDLQSGSRKTITENEKRIRELEDEISSLNLQISDTRKLMLQTERETLISENSKIKSEYKLRSLRIREFKGSEIYKSFHSPDFHPTDADYLSLEYLENQAFGNCINKIRRTSHVINKNDIRICILLKADLSLKTIAVYMGYELNALSMARARLYSKLFNKKGTVLQLDEFIRNL
jgi:tetratricopeptide (TPR) repeat protein